MNTYTHTNYTFDKVAKTVNLTGFTGLFEQIKLITHIPTGTIIYDAVNQVTKGGSLAGVVLTLVYDTNTGVFNNAHKLEIIIDSVNSTAIIQSKNKDVSGSISATNLNLNSGTPTANSFLEIDVQGFKEVVVQVTGTFSGTIIPTVSNNNTNWLQLIASVAVVGTNTSLFSSFSGAGIYVIKTNGAKYLRLNGSGWVSGTTVLTCYLNEVESNNVINAYNPNTQVISGNVSINGNVGTYLTNQGNLTIASGIITASGSINSNLLLGLPPSILYKITALTGTNVTIDLSIEESVDAGSIYYKVYDFPRITAIGNYYIPRINNNYYKIVETVGGTTPSITRQISSQTSQEGNTKYTKQSIDRSVNINSISSVTGSLLVRNCENFQLSINCGAITTTVPQIQLQGSDDNGVTYSNFGSILTGVANSTTSLVANNFQFQLVRAIVTTAGSGVTLGWVLIKGF